VGRVEGAQDGRRPFEPADAGGTAVPVSGTHRWPPEVMGSRLATK
jgi:hypothetical protein